jgi:hypothetical protein
MLTDWVAMLWVAMATLEVRAPDGNGARSVSVDSEVLGLLGGESGGDGRADRVDGLREKWLPRAQFGRHIPCAHPSRHRRSPRSLVQLVSRARPVGWLTRKNAPVGLRSQRCVPRNSEGGGTATAARDAGSSRVGG